MRFSKALCFVIVCAGEGNVQEFLLVQVLETLDDGNIPSGSIDRALRCLRLRWQITPGESGIYFSSREFGMVPV